MSWVWRPRRRQWFWREPGAYLDDFLLRREHRSRTRERDEGMGWMAVGCCRRAGTARGTARRTPAAARPRASGEIEGVQRPNPHCLSHLTLGPASLSTDMAAIIAPIPQVLPTAADLYVSSLPTLPYKLNQHPTHPLNIWAGLLPSDPGEAAGGGDGSVGRDAKIL